MQDDAALRQQRAAHRVTCGTTTATGCTTMATGGVTTARGSRVTGSRTMAMGHNESGG